MASCWAAAATRATGARVWRATPTSMQVGAAGSKGACRVHALVHSWPGSAIVMLEHVYGMCLGTSRATHGLLC